MPERQTRGAPESPDSAEQIQRVGSLEVEQDLGLQQRMWRVQRVGWGVMALLVLAAAAGLTGSGPLSQTSAATPGGALRLDYDRFLHAEGLTTLQVHLGENNLGESNESGTKSGEGQRRIWISRAYLEKVPIERSVPEPERVEVGADRVTYVFAEAPAGAPAARVTFYGSVTTLGRVEGQIGLPEGPSLRFQHFVYP
jgi:hypothetical protein